MVSVDRCALFVDAGYALADGAMAVHGTRRRDSVSWDYAGLLKLLASLARDRTGLPVLRCYWYETVADGGKTVEHDALAEIPGLKLRLVESRRGRREGTDSHLRRDLLTLAKNGAISDAFIASADDAVAEIVSEAQDLGVRVVVLHISSDEGWTIPQPLRQECDDIVEISRVHLRPHVELIQGAEPADSDDRLVPANGTALEVAGGIGDFAIPGAAVATDAPRPVAAALQAIPAGIADGNPGGNGFGTNAAFQPAPLASASASAPGSLPVPGGTAEAVGGYPGSGAGTAAFAGANGSHVDPGTANPGDAGAFGALTAQDRALGAPPGGTAFPPSVSAQDVRARSGQPGNGLPGVAPAGVGQMAPPPGGQSHGGQSHGGQMPGSRGDDGAAGGPYLPGGQTAGQQFGAAADGYLDGQVRPARPESAGAEADDHKGAVPYRAVTTAPGFNGSGANGGAVNGGYPNGAAASDGYSNGAAMNGRYSNGTAVNGTGGGGITAGNGMNGGYPNGSDTNGNGLPTGGRAGTGPNGYGNGFDAGAAQQAAGAFGGYPNGNGQNGHHERSPHVSQGPQAGERGVPYGSDQHRYANDGSVPAGYPQNGVAPQPPNGIAPNGGYPNGANMNGGYPSGAGAGGYQSASVGVQNPQYRSPEPASYPGQPGGENGHRAAAVPAQREIAYPDSAQYSRQGPAQAPAVRAPAVVSLPDAVQAAHAEGFGFGESVGRDAPGLWLEAVLARKPRMPSDLEARLLQGSALPIDSLLHDEVRHSLRRGFWEALESARR